MCPLSPGYEQEGLSEPAMGTNDLKFFAAFREPVNIAMHEEPERGGVDHPPHSVPDTWQLYRDFFKSRETSSGTLDILADTKFAELIRRGTTSRAPQPIVREYFKPTTDVLHMTGGTTIVGARASPIYVFNPCPLWAFRIWGFAATLCNARNKGDFSVTDPVRRPGNKKGINLLYYIARRYIIPGAIAHQ